MSDTQWNLLFRVAAWGAILTLLTIPAQVIVFMVSPPPETVLGWFELFEENMILGLLNLDLIYIISQVFMVPVFIALYIVLRETNPSLALLAVGIGLFGLAVHTTSNPSFDMFLISQDYAAATGEAESALYLAAGEVLLARWAGLAYTLGYAVGGASLLLFALIMWQSTVFTHLTAGMGIAMGILTLVPASLGTIGLMFSFLSLIPTMFWLGLIARRFLILAGDPAEDQVQTVPNGQTA